jgi:DNA-binding transcriptional LysR family regulator
MEMMERPLDLDAVRAFIRIAELDSFTRAAEVMQTTQAAVGLKLQRLEERLGCRLVERAPRSVQLSARGAAFLEHARPVALAGQGRPAARRAGRAFGCFQKRGSRLAGTAGIPDE